MTVAALWAFQDDFARALIGGDAACGPAVTSLIAQPGFAVYRNTVTKGCVDALQANFPAVARLVGEEWFRAAGALYARSHLPRDPCLVHYGGGFPEFLDAFEPARELPYLAAVARLDRSWSESHVARDEPPLSGAGIAALSHTALARAVLRPHGAARWAWFEREPIAALWSANRADDDAEVDLSGIPWCGGGVLITRPGARVTHVLVDRAACSLLDACRAGRTVEQAALAALAADPHADLTRLMALLIGAGAFAELRRETDMEEKEA